MKKSLLALAVLSAFAGAAAAQSSLTIFGVVDANVGKDVGSDDKRVGQGAQSRLGFRGVEDLGNGLKATFHFQTRFDSGTGANQGTAGTTSPFWQAEANVGLAGNFGNLRMGRQYTEAFYHTITVDPWGYDTVANLKPFLTGAIAADRVNNSISYWITNSGITFGAQVAETADNGGVGASSSLPGTIGTDRPVNVRLQYAAGPIAAGISYEDPSDSDDDWTLVSGAYDLGVARIGVFLGSGTSAALLDRKSYGITATAPYGQGQARVAFGKLEGPSSLGGEDETQRQQVSLGYFYSLSKRTTIYGDIANAKTENGTFGNGKDSDTGYDFGIKHVF